MGITVRCHVSDAVSGGGGASHVASRSHQQHHTLHDPLMLKQTLRRYYLRLYLGPLSLSWYHLLTSSHHFVTHWCYQRCYDEMLWWDVIASPDHSWLEPGPGHVNTHSGSGSGDTPAHRETRDREFTLLRQTYFQLDKWNVINLNMNESKCFRMLFKYKFNYVFAL